MGLRQPCVPRAELCFLVGPAWGPWAPGTFRAPRPEGREGKRTVGMLCSGARPCTALQRGCPSPSHGHPHFMGMAVAFPNPQGDGKEGFPGPPGHPGDPGDRVSFPREGKVGRSQRHWRAEPRGTPEGSSSSQHGCLPCHARGDIFSILLCRALGDRRGSRAGR